LVETLLVGVAVKNGKATVGNLEALNTLRRQIVGDAMDVPTGAAARKRRKP
jgi:hypothetical protein